MTAAPARRGAAEVPETAEKRPESGRFLAAWHGSDPKTASGPLPAVDRRFVQTFPR